MPVRDFRFDAADYAALAELRRQSAEQSPFSTVSQLQSYDRSILDVGKRLCRRVIPAPSGAFLAVAEGRDLLHHGSDERLLGWIGVTEAHRRAGVASRLLSDLIPRLQAVGATEVVSMSSPGAGEAFCRWLGGGEIDREHCLALTVASLPAPDVVEVPIRKVAQFGVEVRALAALKPEVADWAQRLWRLHGMVYARVPSGLEYQEQDFDTWVRQDLEADGVDHDALFVARLGDEWVGLSEMRRTDAEGVWLQYLTGVVEPFVRRGIGAALKAATLRYAQDNGVTRIETSVLDDNPAMLSLNRRTGFQVVGQKLTFQFALEHVARRVG